MESKQNSIYIYGAGRLGVLTALDLEEKEVFISGFIDSNEKLLGKTRLGYQVISLDSALRDCEKMGDKIFIVAAVVKYEEVKKKLLSAGLKEYVDFQVSNVTKPALNVHKDETELLALGSLLSKQQHLMRANNFNDYEFKIFSQFGDDGLIQYLIKNIKIENEIFVEFGVEDFSESNSRFLMMNNNWKGFVMDGSEQNIAKLKKENWFWKYSLKSKAAFITKENINELLAETNFENIGLLHIDLDGNDAHILKELDFAKLNPAIFIAEYNSVFGKDRAITVPYNKDFNRTEAHYSNLYWGASLPALVFLANNKGYCLIGCNLAGNNAYFARKDLLNEKIKEKSVDEAYILSKYRESRNENGSLSYLDGEDRYEAIKGLPVVNVVSGKEEVL